MIPPDFLYADHGLIAWRFKGFNEPGLISYVRRDTAVLAELPEVQAMIAAAVEGAAKIVHDAAIFLNAEAEDAHSRGLSQAAFHLQNEARAIDATVPAIRALTPADAKAALDRLMREERNKALREVFYLKKDDDAILALIEEDKP